MLTKADINALFGTSRLSLKKMYKKASEILDKKETSSSISDPVPSKSITLYMTLTASGLRFFYYFGEDRRSVTLHEQDDPIFRYNSVFGMYSPWSELLVRMSPRTRRVSQF